MSYIEVKMEQPLVEHRTTTNEAQKALEKALEEAGCIKGRDFYPEMAILTEDKRRIYVDIGFPQAKVAVEVDGKDHQQKKSRDLERDRRLWRYGWRVIRLSKERVLEASEDCVAIIRDEIADERL